MHLTLRSWHDAHSWGDKSSPTLLQLFAYLGGVAVLSIAAANVSRLLPVVAVIEPAPRSEWIEVARPHPAFALNIPEAADVASGYIVRRHVSGGGRKDIVNLGEPNGPAPYLLVEIYRPGSEAGPFGDSMGEIAVRTTDLGPTAALHNEEQLESKFGPLKIVSFAITGEVPGHCLGFVRAFDDPWLQISGWFCQTGSDFIERSILSCALDRLTLLEAGSDPKVGALFAQAERNRNFCWQRNPLFAATPKYQTLWGSGAASKPRGRSGE